MSDNLTPDAPGSDTSGPATVGPRGFYEGDSLHIRAYDTLHGSATPCVQGDVDFYGVAAGRADGPVLEVGSGTGRVAWSLADRGHKVTGLEISPAMIQLAGRKSLSRGHTSAATSPRFTQGDMRAFDLGREFGLIIAPFRTFHVLLTPEDQLSALLAMRRHLAPDGVLILHLFDPRIDDLSSFRKPPQEERRGHDAETGRRIIARLENVEIDRFNQILENRWVYELEGQDGSIERTEHLTLTVRWTYRQEMKHLLARAGLDVVEEYGDFLGGLPDHGKEQILMCRQMPRD